MLLNPLENRGEDKEKMEIEHVLPVLSIQKMVMFMVFQPVCSDFFNESQTKDKVGCCEYPKLSYKNVLYRGNQH